MLSSPNITVGARDSPLSRAQVLEVAAFYPHLQFILHPMTTTGDLDLKTSLRTLDKTDFFTKEIDEALLQKKFRIAIHSAKDLPEPLHPDLQLVALTHGIDPSDALVYNALPSHARIGTSSLRREQNLLSWRSDLIPIDIRGPIHHRFALLDEKKLDGVVIAAAALIRLNLTHRTHLILPGPTAPLQGKLAIIARQNDTAMQQLFKPLDTR